MAKKTSKKKIEQYDHSDKERVNNPHVGLVTPSSDPDTGAKKTYEYDPHLDPQLKWAGKTEHTSFEVPTVSLHVHERIDPKTIIDTVKKEKVEDRQMSLFAEQKPLREAIDFYKHKEGWTNRLIAGDSLLVMNSLLEKEGMAGKVQMVYFDPPYGIKYGSNFQPFVNKRDVKDGKDEDLSVEPEMIKAFRDTWELGIHSYLTYLRDRLLLTRELLHESGSVFVQISDENVHHVREIMDEVFGVGNFVNNICFQTTPYATSNTLPVVNDYLVWYAKDKTKIKYRQLFKDKEEISSISLYRFALSPDGKSYRPLTKKELETNTVQNGWPRYRLVSLVSQGASSKPEPFEFEGKTYFPPSNSHWKVKPEKLHNVATQNRIQTTTNSIQFRSFIDDFPISMTHNLWTDTITGSFTDPKNM
ncbi:MAG: site-specific DNA-methyltransferase [Candidatus Scalindua sp.]|nr:site-specific DNA-methyltransferase [Candidatus Scalindua sp.]